MSYAFAIPRRRSMLDELVDNAGKYVSQRVLDYKTRQQEKISVKQSYREIDDLASKTSSLLKELNSNEATSLKSHYNTKLESDVKDYISSRRLDVRKAQEAIRTSGKNATGEYARLVTYINDQRKGYLISLMAGLDSLGGKDADDSLASSLGGSTSPNPQDPKSDEEKKEAPKSNPYKEALTEKEEKEVARDKSFVEEQLSNFTEPEDLAITLYHLSGAGEEAFVGDVYGALIQQYGKTEEFKIFNEKASSFDDKNPPERTDLYEVSRYFKSQIDNLTEPETVVDALYKLSEVGKEQERIVRVFSAITEKYKGTEVGERFRKRAIEYDNHERVEEIPETSTEKDVAQELLVELETKEPNSVRLHDIDFWSRPPSKWTRSDYEEAVHTLYDIQRPRYYGHQEYRRVDVIETEKKIPLNKRLFRRQKEYHTEESAAHAIEEKTMQYWSFRAKQEGFVVTTKAVEKEGETTKEYGVGLPLYARLIPKLGQKMLKKREELERELDPHPIDSRVNPLGQAFRNFYNNPALNNRNPRLSYKPLIYTTAAVLAVGALAYYYRHNISDFFNSLGSIGGPTDTPSPEATATLTPDTSPTPSATPTHTPSPTHVPTPHASPTHTQVPNPTHNPAPHATARPPHHSGPIHTASHSGVFKAGLDDYFEWGYLKDQGHLKRVHTWNELNTHIKSLIDNNPGLTESQQHRLTEACKKGYLVYDHYVPTESALKADPYLYGASTKAITLDNVMNIGQSIGQQMMSYARIGVSMTANDIASYYQSLAHGVKGIFA